MRSRRARKRMRLDQALLDEARAALGVTDETEAVTLALQRVVANRRVADGIRALGGRRALDASRIHDLTGCAPSAFGFLRGTVLAQDDIFSPDVEAWGERP